MMKTITEHIRSRLLRDLQPAKTYDLSELRETEWSDEFEQRMRNRLLMGVFRYARLYDKEAPRFDHIGSIIRRAQKYLNDGNKEHLVDVANYALLEYVRPHCHPNPSWSPADDGEHAELIGGQ